MARSSRSGSWIGGNIAAALNGTGTNGIALKDKLVAPKISQWCGSTFDDTIPGGIHTAVLGIDLVNISFGGYSDLSEPEQALIYQAYVDAVRYARSKGTLIVASAGNEHVRIGAGGRVLSHGDYTRDGVLDILAVNRVETGSGRTAVHVLDGAQRFTRFAGNFATVLHPTNGTWDFTAGDYNRDGMVDVLAVNRSDAGSGRTAIHVLDGAQRFGRFVGNFATVLHPTDAAWSFD